MLNNYKNLSNKSYNISAGNNINLKNISKNNDNNNNFNKNNSNKNQLTLYDENNNNKNDNKSILYQKPSKESVLLNTYNTTNSLNNNPLTNFKHTATTQNITSIDNKDQSKSQYVKYNPSNTNTNNNNTKQRIIKIQELPTDPLEPSKFRHKKMQRENAEEPVPIMHSPKRNVTAQDAKDFKIPPCVSIFNNKKGYTIPLEMRVAADGRNLKNIQINEKFSNFSDVMVMAEKNARREIEERNKINGAIKLVDTLKKEQQIREAADEARRKKIEINLQNISNISSNDNSLLGKKKNRSNNNEDDYINNTNTNLDNVEQRLHKNSNNEEDLNERNHLRYLRKKEIERERRLEGIKEKQLQYKLNKNNINNNNNENRDISETVALGQAQPSNKDSMIDSRMYSKTSGLDSGFKQDDDYNLYDKPLFEDRSQANIYKNIRNVDSTMDTIDSNNNNTSDINELKSKKLIQRITNRGKLFEGASFDNKYTSNKTGKIEFEKEEDTQYGLIDNKKSK